MRASLFRIGLAFVVAGGLWISAIFAGAGTASHDIMLEKSASSEVGLHFAETGIGFYRIDMPGFDGGRVFVQVLDDGRNVIKDDAVKTRMSVGYFECPRPGEYTLKITNISDGAVDVRSEFGETRSKEMAPAGILIVVGVVAVMTVSYMRIYGYRMEQPDENIS